MIIGYDWMPHDDHMNLFFNYQIKTNRVVVDCWGLCLLNRVQIHCLTIDDEMKGSKLVKPAVLYLIRHDTGLCKKQEINVKKKQDLI